MGGGFTAVIGGDGRVGGDGDSTVHVQNVCLRQQGWFVFIFAAVTKILQCSQAYPTSRPLAHMSPLPFTHASVFSGLATGFLYIEKNLLLHLTWGTLRVLFHPKQENPYHLLLHQLENGHNQN